MARLNQIICPHCKTTLNSKAGVPVGQKVPCPKCKAKFEVKEPEVVEDFEVLDEEPVVPPAAKKAPPITSKKTASSKINNLDDEEEKPRVVKRRPVEDDEDELRPTKRRTVDEDDDEDRPRSKAKRRDVDESESPRSKKRPLDDEYDDDDYDRPRKKKRGRDDEELGTYGKLKHNLWVRVSVLIILLATAGVLGYMLYQKNKKEKEPQDENAPETNNQFSRPSRAESAVSGTTGILKEVGVDNFKLNFLAPSGAMSEKSYTLAPDAKILLDGKTVPLSELTIKLNVTITLDDKGQVTKIVQKKVIIGPPKK